jgi:nucleoid-associated protein EbfC
MNFNFLKLLKNTSKIKEMVEQQQKEFEKITVTGEAGAGSVKIVANMRHYIQSLEISNELFEETSNPEELKEIISELIIAAHNQVTEKIEQYTKEKLFNMDGLGDLFGGSTGGDMLNDILNPSSTDDKNDKSDKNDKGDKDDK